jgi:uncharacterized protein
VIPLRLRLSSVSLVISLLPLGRLAAQVPRDIAIERAGFAAWLKDGTNSPLAAIARQQVGDGIRLGPEGSDIPLAGVEEHRLYFDGAVATLESPRGKQTLPHRRPVHLGTYTLYLSGLGSKAVVTVFGERSGKQPPGYFNYDPRLVFTGPMERSKMRAMVRVLAADGTETDATEAGAFVVPLGGPTSLRVLRMPVGESEESELEIFFRDETNGKGTYPAGRFVSLVPLPDGQFRLDLNRARNPFCAYSSVYPCPLPWRGNVLAAPVRAGERYAGGGLEAPAAQQELE